MNKLSKVPLDKLYSHEDKIVHLSSMGYLDPTSTLCLNVDVFEANYEVTSEEVSCKACIRTFELLKNGMYIN